MVEQWVEVKTGRIPALVEAAEKRRPDKVFTRSRIDEHASGMDNFGLRITTLLTPPETGDYTLYLAADDTAELWLSTDADRAHLKKVCEVGAYMPRHHFVDGRPSCKVHLVKGKKYYLQILYKEAINDDHVALAWSGPGLKKKIIARKYLEPSPDESLLKQWQQTMAKEERSGELRDTMRNQAPEALAGWLDSLSPADRGMLMDALTQAQRELERKSPAAFEKGMRVYAKVAAGIKATPETPVRNPLAKQLLLMEEAWLKSLTQEQLLNLGPHRLASSLGSIPAKARSVKLTQKLDSRGDKWGNEMVSTGMYAMPGKVVTVTLPPELAGKGLEMQVGHHFHHRNMPLVCMPGTTRHFGLEKENTTFVTPHGGLMLLKVPRNVELKRTPVTIEGAMKAPRFILGRHTDEEWKKIKQAPAPWGELVSEHMVMVLPRDILQNLSNPTEVMTWWNQNNKDLEDFYSYYPKHPFRMHCGHYAVQGVAMWPLQWHPQSIPHLLNMEAMREKNAALFLHEHGHHCDFGEMELSFWSEATPNWGGYYMKSRKGKQFAWKDSHDRHLRRLFDPNNKGMQEIMQEKWYKINSRGVHHWSYPVTSMMIAYAEDFGWENIKKVIKRFRDKTDAMYHWDFLKGAEIDQAKIDRYLVALSEAAGRDVRPYFAHFKMFPSEGAASLLDKLKLPRWDITYLVQPESTTISRNTSLTIPCGTEQLLSFAGKSSIKWHAATAKGGRVDYKGGAKAVYTPKADFTGVDTLRYELLNEYGRMVEKEMEIKVE